MGGFDENDTAEGLLAVDGDLLSGEQAAVHATHRGHLNQAAVLNVGDYHADLVDVGVQHHMGLVRAGIVNLGNDAVAGGNGDLIGVVPKQPGGGFAGVPFLTGDAGSAAEQGQLFVEIHGKLPFLYRYKAI